MLTRTVALAALMAAVPLSAMAQSALPTPVETSALQELNAWSVSAMARGEGALAPDLWARSDPAFLAAAFDKLPAVYNSPATQALARRVLFTGGDAPRGDAQAAARKRFEAIGRMGAADQLAMLVSGAGSSANDPVIAQYGAQAELARGQRNAGYAVGLTQVQTYRYVLLPMAYRIIIPPLTSELMNLIKNTSVAYSIGLVELFFRTREMGEMTFRYYEAFFAATVIYIVIAMTANRVMAFIERRAAVPGYITGAK